MSEYVRLLEELKAASKTIIDTICSFLRMLLHKKWKTTSLVKKMDTENL